jgi:hypothetical protein
MTEATLRSEKAALGQAQVDREEAASLLARLEKLVAAGAATRGEVEDARFEYRRAKAAEARVAAVVAQWRTKRAQLERQLADTELRAPFSGTVAERYVDPGGMAGPGTPVVRLISSDALWVRFAVPPHDLQSLGVGTIVAKNFLPFARVLARSFREQHPRIPFFVVLADRVDGAYAPATEPFETVVLEELGNPDLHRLCFRYTRQQLSIVVKPHLLRYLLDRGFTPALFLDADILILDSLQPLFERAGAHAIALTPHLLAPLPDCAGTVRPA